jgi:exosome complex component RRP42
MNNEMKQHVVNALKKNVRIDGRKLVDYREITVETDIASTAEGSARVKIGETEILAGVKMEIASPFPDRPEEGAIMLNAEFLPMASPEFESGPPGMPAIELARVVDRGIRESGALDLKKLCIKKGEKCWMIVVDICIVNDAGNLLDAAALGAIAAIRDANFPTYENDELDYKKPTDKKIELTKTPIAITVLKIGDCLLVDPMHDEEASVDSRLTVTTTEDGVICALQKGGLQPILTEDVDKMLDLAMEKAKVLRKLL